jgi:hypothetical protein
VGVKIMHAWVRFATPTKLNDLDNIKIGLKINMV